MKKEEKVTSNMENYEQINYFQIKNMKFIKLSLISIFLFKFKKYKIEN